MPPRSAWHLLGLETDNTDLMGVPRPALSDTRGHRVSSRCPTVSIPRAHMDPLVAQTSPASLKPTGYRHVAPLGLAAPVQGLFLALLGCQTFPK